MDWHRAVLVAGTGLAVLIAGKFVFLLAENGLDVSQAPVAFLVPLVLIVVGVVLVARGRAGGALLIAVVAALLIPVFLMAVVTYGFEQQTPADAVLVFGGLPLAVLAVVGGILVWRGRRSTTEAT